MLARDAHRLEPQYYNGFLRTNYTIDITSASPESIIYKITPIGIGKAISPFAKVKIIIGEILFVNKGKPKLHPIFEFAVKQCALYLSMSYETDLKAISNLVLVLASDQQNNDKRDKKDRKDKSSQLILKLTEDILKTQTLTRQQKMLSEILNEPTITKLNLQQKDQLNKLLESDKLSKAQQNCLKNVVDKKKLLQQGLAQEVDHLLSLNEDEKTLQKIMQDKLLDQKESALISKIINSTPSNDQQLQRPRVATLRKYNEYLDKEAEQTLNKTMSFLEQDPQLKKMNLSPQHIKTQIESVRAIEFLTISQQLKKIQLFTKKFQQYLMAPMGGQVDPKDIKLRRFSNQSQPVLQRLSEFIELRKENMQFRADSEALIKDIYKELINYSEKVKEGNPGKSRFIHLSPETIVIDQFTLKSSIYFQPLLKEAFGLTNNPMSIESRLSYEPTPKGFDYFRAPLQLSQDWKMKTGDPMYGLFQLYETDDTILKNKIQNQVKQQKEGFQKDQQLVLNWRFLLLAYYVFNGEQFGRVLDYTSWEESELYFKRALHKKQQELKENSRNLRTFLPMIKGNTEFNIDFPFEMLKQYLVFSDFDSTVESHHLDKTHKYYRQRWSMVLELINLMSYNSSCFEKMMNSKKYLINYLILLYERIVETRRMVQVERQKIGQRKKLRYTKNTVSLVHNKRAGDNNDHLVAKFDKLESYMNRQARDKHYKFLSEKDGYLMKEIRALHRCYLKMILLNEELNEFQDQDRNTKEQYKKILQEVLQLTKVPLQNAKTLLQELTYSEVHLKDCTTLHKIGDSNPPDRWIYVTRKYMLTLYTYLTMNEDNFPQYDSLIIPLLSLGMDVVRHELKSDQLKDRNEDLDVVEELIHFKEQLSTTFKILKH